MTGLISRKALIEALKANTMSNGTLINTNTMVAVIEKFPSAPEHTFENCHNATCRRKCRAEGYNKAIDDFAERIKDSKSYIFDDYFGYVIPVSEIDEIAQQLKDGGTDGSQTTDN